MYVCVYMCVCMYVGACGREREAGRGRAGAGRGQSEEGHVRTVHHSVGGAHRHPARRAHLEALSLLFLELAHHIKNIYPPLYHLPRNQPTKYKLNVVVHKFLPIHTQIHTYSTY